MRVLITVNPGLVRGEKLPTIGTLVAALHAKCDLTIAPIDGYDFKEKEVRAFKAATDGSLCDIGLLVPQADLWIIYSDGFWLDARTMGFARRMDFHRAQFDLYEHHLEKGTVGLFVNSLPAEQRTLKSWLATLDPAETSVIPTYCVSTFEELRALRSERGELIAKLTWGGAMKGLRRLTCDADIDLFHEALAADYPYLTIESFCFQDHLPAAVEKRFYIAGGKCIGARQVTGRWLPWRSAGNEQARRYDDGGEAYRLERAAAERLAALAGLTVGSVDFVGSRINEINGGGTVFTYEDAQELDFRQVLADFFVNLVTERNLQHPPDWSRYLRLPGGDGL